MIWWIFFVIFTVCVRLSNSLEGYYQPPRGSSVWGYFTPPLLYRVPTRTHQTAMDAMVDLTNNLGVTILKDHSYSKGNFAFSPYGVASVLVVLYEGACGESASQIHRAIGFPFDKDVIRVGFRSIHRHLRSYFSHEGYLSGISLNKEGSALKPEFKRILKFYGYDVDVNHPVDEDISLEDLASPATPSGGTIANSNVTSPSPTGVTEDDKQSMSNTNTTEDDKKKRKEVTKKPEDKTTEKPESTTKDGNDSSEEEEEKPDETGDDDSKDKETEKPEKSPEDDVSVEENKESPDKVSGDVDSAEKETVEKTTEDTNTLNTTEEAKPDDTDKNQNSKETEDSDKTSTENSTAVEEDKESSDMTEEDGSSSSAIEKEETGDTTDSKETDNSDKTSEQDSDTVEEDKQNGSDSGEESNDTADDQENNKESETENKTSEDDNNSSQEEKENSGTEDQSEVAEKENEKVCAGREDCENKTEGSTTAKQESEEMSITTVSDGLGLNKTEATEKVEVLQVTSSTIKNSDENSENSETGVPTPETESEDGVSENLESPLTSTMDPHQGEEVTKTTESGETEKTTTTENIDNGMLIPQSNDLLTNPESSTTEAEEKLVSTTPDTTEESKTEEGSPAETTTTKPHSRRKRSSPGSEKLRVSNRLRPVNKISVWGQMKLAGVESSRHVRQAFHPKLSAKYRTRKERTITDYLKWPPASDVSLQLQNGMFDSHVSRNLELYKSLPRLMFLVDGAIDTPVPMMTYTHIFPYAYIPRLHTKALEFPLDDVRYKLLILLPVERRGLRQLIYDLTEFPLREVFTSLQPTRVRAMIPPFMVEGFVILTSSLQKLGIWDVFDPRKSNLSGMSIDPELYVRNVEQSVTVVIRNYVEILDIQTRTMAARNIEHDFEASHPFLYFVLDTATNVALMAGQILDPLNSRIY